MGSNPYPCNKKSPTTDVVGDFGGCELNEYLASFTNHLR
jgi:hypothetical protein